MVWIARPRIEIPPMLCSSVYEQQDEPRGYPSPKRALQRVSMNWNIFFLCVFDSFKLFTTLATSFGLRRRKNDSRRRKWEKIIWLTSFSSRGTVCLVLSICFDGHCDSSSRSQVSAKAEKQKNSSRGWNFPFIIFLTHRESVLRYL